MNIFPKPKQTLWALIGPSIIFVALSLNGGEMLLWPSLVSGYGLSILWLVPVILLLQYYVNLEIERYSITTGKNTLEGIVSVFKGIRPIVAVAIIISMSWPAWISNAGNIASFTAGYPQFGAITSFILLLLLIMFWGIKQNYYILETISRVGLLTVLAISVYIISQIPDLFSFIITQFENPSLVPRIEDTWLFISALAFGGVAGVLNLVQGDWVASKKYGAYSSPNPQSIDLYQVQSRRNWKEWWNLIVKEHFIIYFGGNLVGIILVSLVASYTLKDSNVSGYTILPYQVDLLNQTGFGLGTLWGIAVTLLFIMAQMTILDASGRLLAQAMSKPEDKNRFSQAVGSVGLIILLIIVINPALNQPSSLLQLSAITSAFVMVFYPPLLLVVNSKKLPDYARPKLINKAGVIGCSVFYAVVLSLAAIISLINR